MLRGRQMAFFQPYTQVMDGERMLILRAQRWISSRERKRRAKWNFLLTSNLSQISWSIWRGYNEVNYWRLLQRPSFKTSFGT